VFGKERRYLQPLKKAPYYAFKCSVLCGETLGGIKVNENLEVLNNKGEVIPDFTPPV